jgi:hypothetical protein
MKRPHSVQEWLFTISTIAMGYSAIIWGVAWVIGFDRYVARPAFVAIGLGACLLLIASAIEYVKELASGSATMKSKVVACWVCAGVLVTGFILRHRPPPENPWLMTIAGFVGVLQPFAALGFLAAAIAPVRSAKWKGKAQLGATAWAPKTRFSTAPIQAFLYFEEEGIPMGTMQVGMVGSDGIVLASDTLWSIPAKIRETFNASKLRIDCARGLAISCARSLETATMIAEKLLSDLSHAELSDTGRSCCSAIERIAQTFIGHPDLRSDVQCLIASVRPTFRLFRLYSGPLFEGVRQMECQEVTDKSIAGDEPNPAIFWSEGYYERRPITTLAFLAAHLVLTARKFNSGTIDGLEVVLCNDSGIHRLDDKSTRKLRAKSAKFDEQLQKSFASYYQQFTYV